MSGFVPVCPCDDHSPQTESNPPGLDALSFRIATYQSLRLALLTPGAPEPGLDPGSELDAWRANGAADLAVMIAEWWAYIGDILTFYNERIINESTLRTAILPESVPRLIALLGYRPRPGIGATGRLATLVTKGQSAVLPKGLQFQSKPGPGEQAQTFELDAETAIGPIDATPAHPPEALAAPEASLLLLQGAVSSIDAGDLLLLRARDGSSSPKLVSVTATDVQVRPDRSKQTRLTVTYDSGAPSITAEQSRLEKPANSSGLWTFVGDAILTGFLSAFESGFELTVALAFGPGELRVVHLAGLARQIRPGDSVLLTAPGLTPMLATVARTTEVVWYSNAATNPYTPPATNPLPVPHTQLTLVETLSTTWRRNQASVTVSYGWIEAAKLKDQPVDTWAGAPASLVAVPPAAFRAANDVAALIAGADGVGVAASLSASGAATTATVDGLPDAMSPLQMPGQVLYNLLPVSRGKSVRNEVLGSGDATVAGQSFTLAKSPVTYLRKGAGYVSTVAITVDGHPWKEVDSFYGQEPDASVFILREDEKGRTSASFGDGTNGARLPTGSNNVVANYRFGSGAASPHAGKLTVVAQPFPGLAAVHNPVAVSGGADADPPDQIRRYAPRSVLTFGRAVSVLDFEAIAALTAAPARVRATWGWDDVRQRTSVVIHVGGDDGVIATVRTALLGSGDPNRPVTVVAAQPVPVRLRLTLQFVSGMDEDAIKQSVVDALAGEAGLFSAAKLNIGQPVFNSAIDAACLSVDGVTAVREQHFTKQGSIFVGGGFFGGFFGTLAGFRLRFFGGHFVQGWFDDAAELHVIDEGSYFDLAPADVTLTLQEGTDGG